MSFPFDELGSSKFLNLATLNDSVFNELFLGNVPDYLVTSKLDRMEYLIDSISSIFGGVSNGA